MKKPWTPEEENWLRNNWDKFPIQEIYAHFPNRTEMSVDLKMHRLRIPIGKSPNKQRVSRNLVLELLVSRIGNPQFFTPKRDFYERTGIGQKRFGQLFRGEANPTKNEYLALAREWNVTIYEAIDMNQMQLNFE